MNSRDLLLLSLKRHDIDYSIKVREALLNADDAIRKKDIVFAKQLINEFVFNEKNNSRQLLNSTQELTLLTILLSEFFAHDDPTLNRLALFFNIFEIGKNSRKFILLKFIITGIAIQSGPALNAAGTYLLDSSMKDVRVSADLGRLLINEITFFASNSLDKLKMLPSLSPIFTNALCLIFAETYKDDQLPIKIIGELIADFMSIQPPLVYTFSIPAHIEVGAFILAGFFRFSVLSELYEEKPSYSKLHLKILECLSNIDMSSPSKPIVYTKFIENIVDQIQRASKVKSSERVQQSIEKLGQIIQISKNFLYGNIPMLMEKLKQLPRNPLMELVISLK